MFIVHKGMEGGKEPLSISGRVDEVMMRLMRGEPVNSYASEKTTLPPREHVASLPLRWGAKDEEQVKLPSAVIVTDYKIGSEMMLSGAEIVADCETGSWMRLP